MEDEWDGGGAAGKANPAAEHGADGAISISIVIGQSLKMVNHDDIIKEVRTIREQLAAQHDYNVRALFAAAKERQQESERKVVKLVPKPLEAVLSSS